MNNKKLNNDWKAYEYLAIDYHRKTNNHIVWHWDNIPEEELENSGYISDYKEHRLNRKENRINNIMDYGIDGLAYDNDNKVYHGLQMKYYKSNSYLTANDLGSFLSIIFGRFKTNNDKSKGYLYYTCRLEKRFHISFIKNNDLIFTKYIPNESDFISKPIEIEIPEHQKELWSHQKDAIIELNKSYNNYLERQDDIINEDNYEPPLKLINIACGCGKTIILGHFIKQQKSNLIIAIAPLRLTVDQLKTRIDPFLEGLNYKSLLIDSDNDGTTDMDTVLEFINNALANNENIILYSTFASCENILMNINFHDIKPIIVVDEAHNLINNDALVKYVNTFGFGILLTATPPSQIEDKLDCENIYEYNISQAIADKRIVDYRLYLPYISKTETNIPLELYSLKYDKILITKAIFLINGMLKTGSRRCITYMKDINECKDFQNILNKVVSDYYGLDLWTSNITSDITKNKRNEILKEFQSGSTNNKLYILNSVRILDEAIDIVKADSVFLSNVSDKSSEIRTVQRSMRSCRLDKENPNKINNIFMWSDDLETSKNVLNLLKEMDSQYFHTKIRIIDLDYDNSGSKKNKEAIKIEHKLVSDYINIECLDMNEMWFRRLEEVKKYIDGNEKRPSYHDKNKDIKRLGSWLGTQSKNTKNERLYIMKEDDIYNEWLKFINDPKYNNYFLDKKIEWKNNLNKVKKYIDENKKRPSYHDKNKDIKRLGAWLGTQLTNTKNERLQIMKEYDIYNEWLKFINDPKYKKYFVIDNKQEWKNTLNEVKKYIDMNNKRPSVTDKNKDIKRLGAWLGTQIANTKNERKDIMKQDEIFNEWKFFISDPKYKKYFDIDNKIEWRNTLNEIKKYIDENNKRPSSIDKNKDIKSLGQWLSQQLNNTKNERLHIMKEDEIFNEWKLFISDPKYKKYFDIDNKIEWRNTLNEIKKYIDENNKRPSYHYKNKDIKSLGNWLSTQIKNTKNERLHIMKEDEIFNEWQNFISDPKYKKYFDIDNKQEWKNTLNEVKKYIDENNKRPSSIDKNKDIKSLGIWLGTQLTNTKNERKDIMKQDEIFNEWKFFINNPKYKKYF
jgi:superfamily II DNA or RNA helicase